MLIKNLEELEKLLQVQLTKKQRRVLNRRELYVLYGGSMGSGKSFLISFMALYYALSYENATCLIGRKFHNSLSKTTQKTFEILFKKIPRDWCIRIHKSEGYYEFQNGSRIYFVGLSDSHESLDKIRGMELIYAGIDECQDLEDDEAFKMIAGRLRQKIKGVKPRMILTCNPTRIPWIRKNFVDGRKRRDFYFLKALPKDNPHLPKDYIKNQKRILSPSEFEILILGKWEKAKIEGCLFNEEKINEAMANNEWKEGLISYGIDVSLRGTTVVAKKNGNKISIPIVMNDVDERECLERIKEEISSGTIPVFVDSIGEGSALAWLLINEGFAVVKIKQNEAPKNQEKYFNLRAENYDRLNQLLDEGLNLPDDIELKNQMLNCKKEHAKDGRIKIENKVKLHNKKQSPDKLDAVVLACIGGGEDIPLEDEKGTYQLINGKRIYDKYAYLTLESMAQEGEIWSNEINVNPDTVSPQNEKEMIWTGGLRPDWRKRRKKWDNQIARWKRSGEYNQEFIDRLRFIR
jgi:phage terminase large subunit